MPTASARRSRILERAQYARTTGDFLINDPDGFPSDYPPALWWYGLDSGAGTYPIGPNGPWPSSVAAVPAVIRATALITGPLASAPFRVLAAPAGGTPAAAPRWLTDPMLLRPDVRFVGAVYSAATQLPRSLFWTEWIRSAIWQGEGAFLCRDDAEGQPLAGTLRMVPHRLLATERNTAGALVWVLDSPAGWDGERVVFDSEGRVTIGPYVYRLVVLRNPHSPVNTEGRSAGVFELAPQVFKLAGQVESYASGTFRAGIPAGYLKVSVPGLTQTAADELKGKWLAAHGGDRRSIAVLNATTEFQPLSLSPVDAALEQVKRLNMADVAFAFGLDPMTLGVGLANSATYTNLRDAWANHRDFGLSLWTAGVEDTLSALLPGAAAVKVNTDGFANPTAAERFAAYDVAIRAGILTVEEVRALEGLAPAQEVPPTQPQPDSIEPPAPEGEVTPNE